MTTEEIIEGNKLIAEFDDDKMLIDVTDPKKESYYREFVHWVHFSDLRYHSSWDWLMPVVEKIENTKLQTYINKSANSYSNVAVNTSINKRDNISEKQNGYECLITPFIWKSHQFKGFSKVSKIEAVWLAVVEFIKWYNQNK